MATPGTDNEAVMQGYTRHLIASANDAGIEFACLVKPDADLGERIRAFDTDNQEWLILNGWNFDFAEPL